jgi:hypothetical protein
MSDLDALPTPEAASLRLAPGHRLERLVVLVAGGLAGGLGLIGMAGWALDLPDLRGVIPGAVEMKANTALALVLASGALLAIETRSARLALVARVLAVAVAGLGLVTLAEHLVGWNPGIDQLLFLDTSPTAEGFPGRMSRASAVSFSALGLALLAGPAPALGSFVAIGGLTGFAIGAVSVLAYAWNALGIGTGSWLPAVAIHTALGLTALGLGVLLVGRAPEDLPLDSPPRRIPRETFVPVLGSSLRRALIRGCGLTLGSRRARK